MDVVVNWSWTLSLSREDSDTKKENDVAGSSYHSPSERADRRDVLLPSFKGLTMFATGFVLLAMSRTNAENDASSRSASVSSLRFSRNCL